VEVVVLKTKYPQGGERQLVAAATGRIVPGGGLPFQVGVVVVNVATAAALARSALRGKPLTHRVVTVSGAGVKHPKNVLTPLGTTYGELIRYCGGVTEDAARVIAGGPMMGFTLSAADEKSELIPTPVTKGTSGITVLNRIATSTGRLRRPVSVADGASRSVRCDWYPRGWHWRPGLSTARCWSVTTSGLASSAVVVRSPARPASRWSS
jgi:Na+-translocating ferredoxin:NAD+ oxidoreductase RnfC subunit